MWRCSQTRRSYLYLPTVVISFLDFSFYFLNLGIRHLCLSNLTTGPLVLYMLPAVDLMSVLGCAQSVFSYVCDIHHDHAGNLQIDVMTMMMFFVHSCDVFCSRGCRSLGCHGLEICVRPYDLFLDLWPFPRKCSCRLHCAVGNISTHFEASMSSPSEVWTCGSERDGQTGRSTNGRTDGRTDATIHNVASYSKVSMLRKERKGRGCLSPRHLPCARKWISHYCMWRVAGSMPNLWLCLHSRRALRLVPNYTDWWQRHVRGP